MKRSILFLFIFFGQLIYANGNDEFRAVWVITWEHISPYSSVSQNKARVRQILDNVKKANMNAVLWQARQSGTAYYNSSFEPWGHYAGSIYPGYDPLAYAIEEGHKRGLEVHAWFNVFQTSSTVPGTPAGDNPHWICRDQSGNSMTSSIAISPGLDTVRAYTINVAMEIVRNYDIDGLHLDYVRWNEYSNSKESIEYAKIVEEGQYLDGMITDEQILDLEENKSGRYLYDIDHPYSSGVPSGYSSWEEWWRWGVTELVRTLHDSIQSEKPWVRLSPAALGKYNWSGWQGYGTVYQDVGLWFNQGFIDQLTPMHYHWTTTSGFYGMLQGNCPSCWKQGIQQGINDGRLFTVGPGSYQFANQNVWYNHPAVVNRCRDVGWVDGFQFFSYGSWENYQYWQEAGDTFFGRKTKIRDTGLISSAIPDEPSISINKIDSLNYEITITPNASISDNQWFALYRSEVSGVNVDTTEIVNIKFADSVYIVLETFDGLQNFNGNYTYGATTLNRYWNESIFSNLGTTDLIPSFAPTVISTNPAEGDSIPINGGVIINFSKSMETASVNSAIVLSPTVSSENTTWSNNNRTVNIEFGEYLQYNTPYSLTVEASATDVNGVLLDGNGDGIPGDPFVLNFKTYAVDNIPPNVIFSYPDFNTQNDTIDVRQVITVLYDELLDPNTLDDNSVAVYKASTKITTQFIHTTTINDQSVINIQPDGSLESNTQYTVFLGNTITDTSGNVVQNNFTINFTTGNLYSDEITMIDNFTSPGGWWQPSGSGSTTGIVGSHTVWGYTQANYLPVTTPPKSAYLRYEWDVSDSTWLIREYIPYTDPKNKVFDTTYVLQAYVYGDGSNNEFRFCIDENDGSGWNNHEVSGWITINWHGWRLIEWKLNDPNSVGVWGGLGNSILDGTQYRIDSFQLTHEENDEVSGEIWIDDFRLVKKSPITSVDFQVDNSVPAKFHLSQNYPNPFNPVTNINFSIASPAKTSLIVYNMLGQKVIDLKNEFLSAGDYSVKFNGTNLSSGTYVYILKSGIQQQHKKMLLIK